MPKGNLSSWSDHKAESNVNDKVNTSLKKTEDKLDEDRIRSKDKNDRATVDNCLDPRTLIIIHKMINNEKIDAFLGNVSTGKEANVYLAEGSYDFEKHEKFPEGTPKNEYAIKVFKTSILIFKDRERYVDGEFRFRSGHCKGNPRKMVKLWAEKETRNLKRINMSGVISAPMPYFNKNNIILMELVGDNGIAAPRLKDANITNIQ
mmetsp:Transcript_25880/g.18326  ORF Transcript_25880/g.18326 Transcript_25880/m.18326 type:complete len:205 (-) Transcript_25880:826-1440(-)